MERIPVSVIVVNWNRCKLLRECLQSLSQPQGVPFEVIVVDNGSSDGSLEMLETEFLGRSPFPVRIIRNHRNRGFAAANNQGIEAASGEWIALLNNDAIAQPGWLQALCEAFHNRPQVGMAASKILVLEDPRRIDKVGHLIYPDGQNRGRGSGELDEGQYDQQEEVLWPDGCAAMYRKAVFDQVGGFDEDFFAYGEDAELGLRARIAGWRCWYVPRAVVWHRRASTLGLASMRRVALIERNRVLLAAKLFPWSLLWLNGAYYLARIAAGVRAAARGRGEATLFPGWTGKLRLALALLMGDFQALCLLPRMLRKRRHIRRFRQLRPSDVKQLILAHRIALRTLTENH